MEDYIFIQSWMIDLFKPKEKKKGAGVDYVKLMIFAYIFSFSRDGRSKWYGKQQTLAEMVGCSESTVCNKLKELVDEGLIIKEEIQNYGMFHHNNYWVNLEITPITSEITQVISEITPIISEKTNNKSVYKSINNIDSIDTTKEDKSSLVLNKEEPKAVVLEKKKEDYIYTGTLRHVDNLGLSPSLTAAVKDWIEMVFNSKGIKLGVKNIDTNLGLIGVYPESIQEELVKEAILRCHSTFKYVIDDYERKKSYKNKKRTNIPDDGSNQAFKPL